MTDAPREWDKKRLEVARLVAGWSKDPKAKVGAVIADRQGRLIALGYNGFAGGIEDSDERLNDNDVKQETILHAEMNAVLIANKSAEGGTLYVVGKPVCARCASVIIQSGIQRVVGQYPDDPCSKWTVTGLLAIQMFKEANVSFDRIEEVLPLASGCCGAKEIVPQHLSTDD
jgi:dCMP deaminase